MRFDERERPSCVTEAEVSSSSPFMRTGGKFMLCLREMCVWMHKCIHVCLLCMHAGFPLHG